MKDEARGLRTKRELCPSRDPISSRQFVNVPGFFDHAWPLARPTGFVLDKETTLGVVRFFE